MNGVRRAHCLWCCKTSLTNNTHNAYNIPVTIIMSSLEEPLAFDKLPSMNTIDRIQRFSSGACRPRDDVGMGHRWIQGRDCTTSNSCKSVYLFHYFLYFHFCFESGLRHLLPFHSDDDESFGKESFPWKRHTRKVSEGEILLRSTSFSARNSSKSFQEHNNYHTFNNENGGISHSINKVKFSLCYKNGIS